MNTSPVTSSLAIRGKLFLLPLLFSLLSPGCKKNNEPKMPPQTKTGEDVLACKVDGKVHIYRGKGTFLHDDGVKYYRMVDDSSIHIQADDDKTYHDQIVIAVHTFHIEIGKPYILSSETTGDGASYFNSSIYVTSINSGVVTFTRCDETIASGTFSFTATDNEGRKVEITEGMFDIKR